MITPTIRTLGLGAALLLLTAACGHNGDAGYAEGTFTVKGGGIYTDSAEGGCGGNLEYNRPFRGGLPVVVRNSSGKILGSGSLENGHVEGPQWCVLPFRIPLSGTSDNYELSFGSQTTVVQDITNVDVGIGPG